MATAARALRPLYHAELDPSPESTSQSSSERNLEPSRGILWGLVMGGLLWAAFLLSVILLIQ